jgi:hypothetical protein
MVKTHEVLTKPVPDTVISPAYHYDDEQKTKMQTLLEVRPAIYLFMNSMNQNTVV